MSNRTSRQWPRASVIVLAIFLVQSACNSSCNSSCGKPKEVDAQLVISGAVAVDCSYNGWSTSGQQKVHITVSGNGNQFSWSSAALPSVANNTYNIKVPSSGQFTINAAVEESDGQSCPGCQNHCGPGNPGTTYWKGSDNSFSSGASTYNLTVKWNKQDGCVC
jgi:hypothetical protein